MRVHDMQFSSVVSVIADRLPPDVYDLMLVLPTDTKLFHLPDRAASPEPSSPAEPEIEQPDVQEQFIAQAQENDEIVEQSGEAITDVQDQINNASNPAERRKAMMKLRRAEQAGTASTCGRCRGAGQVPVAMPDGSASNTACPVCRGQGSIQRYGMRH
jgi:hypothetical protein